MKKLFALLLLIPLIAGCSKGPIAKAKLDAEVKRLCAIDGGIKVYETAPLTSDLFDWAGRIWVPDKAEAKPSDKYYTEKDIHYYRQGNPEMWRDHIRVIRRSDGKIMGEVVGYSRRGGDLPGPWHESSYSCPQIWNLESAIFNRQEKN